MNNLNDKMTLSTPDGAERNTALLTEWVAQTFPNCITEGKVDFDLLRQECSSEIIDGAKERYRLEWSGKRNAIVTANLASDKTLLPIREDSKDFDTTENLYIEGDNLEVLKLMQESYLNQIKMIYIDPPYNTGKEFVYNDDFSKEERVSLIEQGIIDEDGNILTSDKNGQDKPRYHSDWLSFMYPRLKLARNLLTDDGVIFISIDDNEVHNLRKMCDEVFGENNFIGQWNWFKSATPPALSKKIKKNIEYVLSYQKGNNNDFFAGIQKTSSSNDPITKPQNTYKELTFPAGSISTRLNDGIYPKGTYGTDKFPNELLNDLIVQNGRNVNDVTFKNRFIWVQSTLNEQIANGTRIELSKQLVISYKKADYNREVPPSFIDKQVGVDTTENAGRHITELFDGLKIFDYPKPVSLLCYIINFFIEGDKDSIILDFFSGSATTAHAVMQLNAEDGGNRKFIMVQLPEKTDEGTGYKNICEIGKARIRKAADKIIAEHPDAKIDTGFKVLRLGESNINNVMRKPGELTQGELNFNDSNNVVENLKEGRSDEDLIYQVLITWGLPLTLPIVKTEMCGKTVYKVDGNALYCCFEDGVTRVLAEALAHEKPMGVLFADRSFKDDNEKENVKQTLRQISPETEMRVL